MLGSPAMSSPTPTQSRLLELVDAMGGQPVVMLADLVADRFITGTPKRISREAPVLILRHEGETTTPGGGANAIANVAALDGRPLPLGVVGEDRSGKELLEIFAERGIETGGILRRTDYRTPTKTRILGGGRHAIKQQIVRLDIEDEVHLAPADLEALLSPLARWGKTARAVVISDYGYGSAAPQILPSLRQALPKGCPILGDSRYRLGEFIGLSGATPNLEEAEAILGHDLEEMAGGSLNASGGQILKRMGSEFLLITRGSAGMSLFRTGGPTAHVPVHGTDQVADVTGAGDTVIGTFALALAAGATPLEATCLANYAGGVVVMKMGTATLDRDELRAAIRNDAKPLEELQWDRS